MSKKQRFINLALALIIGISVMMMFPLMAQAKDAPQAGNTIPNVSREEDILIPADASPAQEVGPLLVYLGRVPFDPLTESPSIPSSLGGRTPQAQDYWLVQVIGPVLFEWKAQLEGLGLKIINYVPDYTYIVKMDLDARAAVEDLGFVRWVGFYEPGYKIMEDLLDYEGQVPVTVGFFPDEPVGPALSRMGNLGRQPMEVYTGPFAGVIQAELGRDVIFAMAKKPAWHGLNRITPP